MASNKIVRLAVFDVDGTLTDGGIFFGNEGELFKRFDVKDGFALHEILPNNGIEVGIITGRTSEIVKKRSSELGIRYTVQGSKDKVADLKKIIEGRGISPEEVAYMGDDLPDLKIMRICGVSACPADSVQAVRMISDFISCKLGGHGAVREFAEWLVERNEKLRGVNVDVR